MTYAAMVAHLEAVVGRPVSRDERIPDIEVHSLDILEWLFSLESVFGLELDGKAIEIVERGTLGELYDHLHCS